MNKYTLFEKTYTGIVRPLLFAMDPEKVHDNIIVAGKVLGKNKHTRKIIQKIFKYQSPILSQEIHGINFQNPIGLSAGFDKNAELMDIIPSVGFGFEQVGTVTFHAYDGNPRPRVRRLPKSKAVLINYGLKNVGIVEIIERIKSRKVTNFSLGVSVGKTNSAQTAEVETGIGDYIGSLQQLEQNDIGQWYTINISCPNILQTNHFITPDPLRKLIGAIFELRLTKPVFIKMPIHVQWKEFEKLLNVITQFPVRGVIIGNLAKDRNNPAIVEKILPTEKGGISGKPTAVLSNELIGKTYQKYQKSLTIIGVGGVFSTKDAYEKIKRGASLVQLITGMIYKGPGLIGKINHDLSQQLAADGFRSITQAIGSHWHSSSS